MAKRVQACKKLRNPLILEMALHLKLEQAEDNIESEEEDFLRVFLNKEQTQLIPQIDVRINV